MKTIVVAVCLAFALAVPCNELKELYPQLNLDCDPLKVDTDEVDLIPALFSLESTRGKVKALEEKKNKLEALNISLQSQIAESELKMGKDKTFLGDLENEKLFNMREIKGMQDTRAELQSSLESLQNSLESQIKEMHDNNSKLSGLKDQIQTLSKQKAQLQSEQAESISLYKDLAQAIQSVIEYKGKLDLNLDHLKSSIDTQVSHVDILKQEKTHLELEVLRLVESEKELLKSISQFKDQIDKSELQLSGLTVELDKERQEKITLESLLQRALVKFETLNIYNQNENHNNQQSD